MEANYGLHAATPTRAQVLRTLLHLQWRNGKKTGKESESGEIKEWGVRGTTESVPRALSFPVSPAPPRFISPLPIPPPTRKTKETSVEESVIRIKLEDSHVPSVGGSSAFASSSAKASTSSRETLHLHTSFNPSCQALNTRATLRLITTLPGRIFTTRLVRVMATDSRSTSNKFPKTKWSVFQD